MFKTPILFLIFNRPELTLKVFEEIRKIKPEKLFIAADGPRKNKEGEEGKCREVRKIIDKIDWKCEVKTLFRETNLGCKIAVSSAITWFFENVEEGIILEDDCLPCSSFFTFCETLLKKYRDDEGIMHIGGTNVQNGKSRGEGSYYFSYVSNVWGWASWRRAWKNYSIEMEGLDNFKRNQSIFKHSRIAQFNYEKLEKTKNGEINTWDYQWLYSIWRINGICITPNKNLITNIGFDENATHTMDQNHFLSKIPVSDLGPIVHPEKIIINKAADNYYSWKLLGYNNSFDYLLFDIKKRFINLLYPAYKKIKTQF